MHICNFTLYYFRTHFHNLEYYFFDSVLLLCWKQIIRIKKMPQSGDSKVYVGDLSSSASKQDLEDAFSHYGKISSVWVARNPPGFAFVEFGDSRDAEDAVKGLDGR